MGISFVGGVDRPLGLRAGVPISRARKKIFGVLACGSGVFLDHRAWCETKASWDVLRANVNKKWQKQAAVCPNFDR